MRLSQGQLNLLTTCPRKFQHTYLEQLSSPTTLEQQEKLAWGSRFHLLMQQRELGLPIDLLVQEDAQLQRWVTGLVGAAPEILTPNPQSEIFRESEHRRTLNFGDDLLTVIYDLFVASPNSAQIFDWKTYPLPKKQGWLAQNWQTRLYIYVLAETSDYAPEQISMTYWFVQSEPEPKSLKFTYNWDKHEQTKRDLTRLLNQLKIWLQNYEQGEPFPQIPEKEEECDRCSFAGRCNKISEDGAAETNLHWIPDLASIQEVSL
jgi:PD-(D/E)XK nuclease superfamily